MFDELRVLGFMMDGPRYSNNWLFQYVATGEKTHNCICSSKTAYFIKFVKCVKTWNLDCVILKLRGKTCEQHVSPKSLYQARYCDSPKCCNTVHGRH